jgi:membrane-bound lytic murein transglycosylase D
MPATGKMLGLEQKWWYDERRDVIAATEAALDYLESLAEQFDGDWELALAAYNSGAGTVRRAIKKNRKLGKPTDYWSLDLPRGTKRYIPKLLALARVVEQPEAFGTRLSTIPNQPVFDSVNIDANLNLAMAAQMADLTVDELYRLNPGFNRVANAPQDPHSLVLPLENIDQFKENLAGLNRNSENSDQPGDNGSGTRYLIRSGDNLGSIARRYGTTVAALKQNNGMKSSAIQIGKYLYIPEPETVATLSSPAASEKQRPLELAGNRSIYTVRDGDTLWTIAQKYNVNHKSLAQWNGITAEDTLQPGQELIVLNGDSLARNLNSDSTTKTKIAAIFSPAG